MNGRPKLRRVGRMSDDMRQSDNIASSLFAGALEGPWYIAIPRLLLLVTVGLLYIVAVLGWNWLKEVIAGE